MDRNRFNREVRPYVTQIRIGIQGIAFDRLDLDVFADDYKRRNGRPGAKGEPSFKVNTGTRDQEVCRLRWDWEIKLPELASPAKLRH